MAEISTELINMILKQLVVLDDGGLYDVIANGGPPNPTAPPGTRDYVVSKLLGLREEVKNENSDS